MSRLKIRQGTEWIDVCDEATHFRNVETNEWVRFKSGDKVRLPSGNWEQIHCSVPCGGSEMLFPMNQPSTFPVPQRFYFDTGLVQATAVAEIYGATVPVVFFWEMQQEDGSFTNGDSIYAADNNIHNPTGIGDFLTYRQQWINATGLTPEESVFNNFIVTPRNYNYTSYYKSSGTRRLARLTIYAPLQQALPLKIKFHCPNTAPRVSQLSVLYFLGNNSDPINNTWLDINEGGGYIYKKPLTNNGGSNTQHFSRGVKTITFHNKNIKTYIIVEKSVVGSGTGSYIYQQNYVAEPNQSISLGTHTIEENQRLYIRITYN